MHVRRKQLIEFLDGGIAPGSHVGAINGLIGEDLLLGILSHAFKADGALSVTCIRSCLPGTLRGGRLDAQVHVEYGDREELFQVEAKNWCGASYQESKLPFGASTAIHERANRTHWDHVVRLLADKTNRKLSKVLGKMVFATKYANLNATPLCLMWWAVASPGSDVHTAFSSTTVDNQPVRVFSARNYLSSFPPHVDELELDMPRVEERLRWLNSFLPLPAFS